MPNPDLALKPGMYAEVNLENQSFEPTLVVPRSAVIETGMRALVFVSGPDGALMPREVTPGRTSGRFMELLDGVEAGEHIVSSAAFLVDAESNLGTMTGGLVAEGADMEGMEGMDHSGHDE
jgi:Cu(I)/Ag(I) efflux system membrane fusion protein